MELLQIISQEELKSASVLVYVAICSILPKNAQPRELS